MSINSLITCTWVLWVNEGKEMDKVQTSVGKEKSVRRRKRDE